jgi:transposase-like protein
LYQAIGIPEGLAISSDMQKGLIKAVSQVYPLAEHRECMRHLYSNFKKHFSSDLFKLGLWAAVRTYSPRKFERIIAEMEQICPAATKYLCDEHSKLWSRSQFKVTVKCDYITNNISETFNSWIFKERHKPILNFLDSIRKKIMVRFHERRRIARS